VSAPGAAWLLYVSDCPKRTYSMCTHSMCDVQFNPLNTASLLDMSALYRTRLAAAIQLTLLEHKLLQQPTGPLTLSMCS
jgi:hypothetical protein